MTTICDGICVGKIERERDHLHRAQGGCRGGAMDEIGIARDFSRCEYVPASCARKFTAEGINAQLEPLDKNAGLWNTTEKPRAGADNAERDHQHR